MSSTRHRHRGDRITAEFTGKVNSWIRVEREHVFREGTRKQPFGYQWVVSPSESSPCEEGTGGAMKKKKKAVVHVSAVASSSAKHDVGFQGQYDHKTSTVEANQPQNQEQAAKPIKTGSIKLKILKK